MSLIRKLAKSCVLVFFGREVKPRKILRGLASGYRICVSPAENLGYLLGTAEPYLQRAIRAHVNAGGTVYDIGANLGYVSLSLSRQVGSHGQVVAFEPVPRNIESFRQNIEINGIKNVRLMECAASDQSGKAIIRITGNLSTASLVWHRNDLSATEVDIRTVSVDELVEAGDLDYPQFVKIDVEGAEGSALQGMRRTLAAAKPVLYVECSDLGRSTSWRLLHDLGYRCHSAITRESIDHFDDYRHADFLWLPEKVSSREEERRSA